MSKRVLAMALAILAFFIFVGAPFGQCAKAIVGVDDALIAIIIAALAAVGITFYVVGTYGSMQEYVSSLINEYAEYRGMPVNDMFYGVQTGSNKIGNILVNNRFVTFLQGFASWIKLKFSLQNNDSIRVSGEGVTMGQITGYKLPITISKSDIAYGYQVVIGQDVYSFMIVDNLQNPTSVMPKFVSDVSSSVQLITIFPDGRVSQGATRNMSYNSEVGKYRLDAEFSFSLSSYRDSLSQYEWYSDSQFRENLGYDLESDAVPIDIITGTISLPYDDSNYTDGDGAVIDVPGSQWGMTYDEITGAVIPGEFTGVEEGSAAIDYEEEAAVQEQVEDTPAQSISQEVSDYQISGLPGVFPFCIPFDIYAFFECLAAEPVAPSFTWRFYIPGICDEDIEIDLAAFDSAARILRTMELLLFIVGLAFVTRDKFLRG